MAQQLPCQSDDGNLATFIGTNLDTGASETLCAPCLLQFCGTIVEGMTGLPVNELLRDALAVAEDGDDEVVIVEVEGDELDVIDRIEIDLEEHDDPEHSTADVK